MASIAEFDGFSTATPPVIATGEQPSASEPGRDLSRAEGSHTVYGRIARALLPRWANLLRLSLPTVPRRAQASAYGGGVHRQHKRQLAALAAGITCEVDDAWDANAYLEECIRASLIGWQLSLRASGRPSRGAARRHPLQGAMTGAVIRLLDHTSRFQTPSLLGDLECHLTWLAKRRYRQPHHEASTVCALADGATMVRDTHLLDIAKRRLAVLLASQTLEGWFGDGTSFSAAKTGEIVDGLARIHAEHDWDELVDPIRRALRFLAFFTTPDKTFVGYRDADSDAFLSPYGVELMAPTLTEAAALACVARAQCATAMQGHAGTWHDDLCVTLGSRIALAAMCASRELRDTTPQTHHEPGPAFLAGAGIAVFNTPAYHAIVDTRHGGALVVTWRNEQPPLIDGGVAVEFAHASRTSGSSAPHTGRWINDRGLMIEGCLRSTTGRPHELWRRLASWMRFRPHHAASISRGSSVRQTEHKTGICTRLARDRFRREITFGADTVRIRDTVDCRLPCHTVLCQSASLDDRTSWQVFPMAEHRVRPPISVEGGRRVELTRVYENGRLIDMP